MTILLDSTGTSGSKATFTCTPPCPTGGSHPEEAAKAYRDAGYGFIALTDHFVHGESRMEDGLLIMSGCQFDTGDMAEHSVCHIVGIGMERQTNLTRSASRPPEAIVDAISAAGGVAILAHPAWSMANPSDALALTGLCGVEICNTFSGLPWDCRPDSSLHVDLWASQGRLIPCMASDDCHYYGGRRPAPLPW